MSTAGGASFAASHWGVDRVLDDTADVRAESEVAGLACLSELDVGVFDISDLADGGAALDIDQSDLTGGQADLCVSILLCAEDGVLSRCACELCALFPGAFTSPITLTIMVLVWPTVNLIWLEEYLLPNVPRNLALA